MGSMTSSSDPTSVPRTPFWRRPARIVRENWSAYLTLNAASYGLFLVGFVLGLLFPELNTARATSIEDDGTGDLVRGLVSTPPLFALMILVVNVIRLSLATIVLPSLVVPFAGLAFFGYWAVETGVTLVPGSSDGWVALIPHSLTVLIELQAYILLLLGVVLFGRSWLAPATVGAMNRRRGYLSGLQRIGLLALPAFALLVIGAIWRSFAAAQRVGRGRRGEPPSRSRS